MSTIIENLTLWGADCNSLMERLSNDEEFIVMCLNNFLLEPSFAELKQSIEKKEYSEAFKHVRCLKGTAANLDLTPIYQCLSDLTEKLRNEDYDIDQEYQEVINQYNKLKEIVNNG